MKIASCAAMQTNAEVLDILNPGNGSATKKDLRGYKILIVDDVFTTGRTAAKAENAIKKLNPKSISFYAIAKAKDK